MDINTEPLEKALEEAFLKMTQREFRDPPITNMIRELAQRTEGYGPKTRINCLIVWNSPAHLLCSQKDVLELCPRSFDVFLQVL